MRSWCCTQRILLEEGTLKRKKSYEPDYLSYSKIKPTTYEDHLPEIFKAKSPHATDAFKHYQGDSAWTKWEHKSQVVCWQRP